MFNPQTPLTPTAGRSSLQIALASSPMTSSPLAPANSSPLARLSVFKTSLHGRTREPLRRLPRNVDIPYSQGMGAGMDGTGRKRDEEPVKMLWRERLEQRCRKRAEKDRGRALRKSGVASSQEDEGDMDEDESGDTLDDELVARVILADIRQQQRQQDLIYARDVGSSIDPDMYDVAAMEEEATADFDTGPSPPESEIDLESDPSELYEAYLADISASSPSLSDLPPSSPPALVLSSPPPSEYDFDFDMSSPPSSPPMTSVPESSPHITSLCEHFASSPCLSCGSTSSLQSNWDAPSKLQCVACGLVLALEDAEKAWAGHVSPGEEAEAHGPLYASDPSLGGSIILCAAEGCEFFYAL